MKLNFWKSKDRQINRWNRHATSEALLTQHKIDLTTVLKQMPGVENDIQDILDKILDNKKREDHLGAVLDILKDRILYWSKYEDQEFGKEILKKTIFVLIRDYFDKKIEKENKKKQTGKKQ